MYERITSENVVMYAIKNYNNPQCEGELEFLDDLKDLSTSKDYLKNIKSQVNLENVLLLNHFIVLNNVFGSDAITLLLYKIDKEHWGVMKSFLIYLNMLEKYELSDIRADEYVLEELRKI